MVFSAVSASFEADDDTYDSVSTGQKKKKKKEKNFMRHISMLGSAKWHAAADDRLSNCGKVASG